MMCPSYSFQKRYHDQADRKRFFNRVKNPFIRSKEEEIARRICRRAGRSSAKVLEIGSGEGSNLFYLQQCLPAGRFVGLDFSEEKLRFMADQVPFANPVCGNALLLPFKESSFDVVLLRDLLHHVPWDREQVLVEALRVVTPEGEVILLEGKGSSLLNRIFRRVNAAERGMKDNTPAGLSALCNRHGPSEIELIEAGFLLRAVSMFLRWPEHGGKWIIAPLYASIWAWERICALVLPKRFWTYMMISLRRRES